MTMDDGMRLKLTADAVVVPGPESIVRRLAFHSEPVYAVKGLLFCNLCEQELPASGQHGYTAHRPTCPWRMAREWADANPQS